MLLPDAAAPSTGPLVARAPAVEIGDTLGHYTLRRALGRGATSVVYAAWDRTLEREVAVKVLVLDGDLTRARRTIEEARAAARFDHPNLVRIFEHAFVGSHALIAMELRRGDLATWIATAPRPSRRDLLAALIDAARGLAAMHQAGLVHGDVKPSNILVDGSGRAALGDFGLTRGAAAPPRPHGTAPYLAPEALAGAAPTPATDQYALGMTATYAFAALAMPPGRRLRAILAQATAPDPAARFATVAAFGAALSRVATGPGPRAGMLALAAGLALLVAHPPTVPGPAPCALAALAPPTRVPGLADAALQDAVSAYAARWRAVALPTCSAPRAAATEACLALAGADASARVRELATGATAETRARVDAWHDPRACIAPAAPLIPLDDLRRAAVTQLRAALAVNRRSDALAAVQGALGRALLDRATTLGFPAVTIEAHLALAAVLDEPDADEHRAAAVALAERHHLDRLRAHALVAIADASARHRRAGARDAVAAAIAALPADEPVLAARLALAAARLESDASVRAPLVLVAIAAVTAAHTAAPVTADHGLALAELAERLAGLEPSAAWAMPWQRRAVAALAQALGRAHHRYGFEVESLASMLTARGDSAGAAAWLATIEPYFATPIGRAHLARYQAELAGTTTPPLPPRRFTVVVRDASGRPVPGAAVATGERLVGTGEALMRFGPIGRALLDVHTGTTAADGALVLPLPRWSSAVVAAETATGRSWPAAVGPDDNRVTLVLRPYGRLTGELDLAGSPATAVHVDVLPLPVAQHAAAARITAPVDAQGRFAVARLPAGPHLVRVYRDGADWSAVEAAAVEVVAGTTAAVTLRLDLRGVAPVRRGFTSTVATQLVMKRGQHHATTLGALRRAAWRDLGRDGERGAAVTERGAVHGLSAGAWTACAASLGERGVVVRLRDHTLVDDLPVHCTQLDLPAATTPLVIDGTPFGRLRVRVDDRPPTATTDAVTR